MQLLLSYGIFWPSVGAHGVVHKELNASHRFKNSRPESLNGSSIITFALNQLNLANQCCFDIPGRWPQEREAVIHPDPTLSVQGETAQYKATSSQIPTIMKKRIIQS